MTDLKERPGIVYLIHFATPLRHARHYIGWAKDLASRLRDHKSASNGSRLLAAVNRAGINWSVVRTWTADRKFERQLKRRREACILCPVCREEKLRRKLELQRKRRNR